MRVQCERFRVTKRYPLTISRGTTAFTENLLVRVYDEGIEGLGEMAPVSIGNGRESAEDAEQDVGRWASDLERFSPWDFQVIESHLDHLRGGRAARAALDLAIHDWIGRRVGQPVWRLLGLDRERIPESSITIGMAPEEVVRERTRETLDRTGATILKVKLGSPDGIEADRAVFSAVRSASVSIGRPIRLRVDANGGWSVVDACEMIRWLADQRVEFVEQPLARGLESDLPALRDRVDLPIYVDESVSTSADLPALIGRVDGVNLKLMKCGGLREAVRFIHTARACGFNVMIGCMSESSLGISAASQIAPLADALDLDSHLNLVDDPFHGAEWRDGRVIPSGMTGLGVASLVA